MLLARKASLKPEEIRAILVKTARHLGAPGINPQFGAGLVNPLKALEQLVSEKQASQDSVRQVLASLDASSNRIDDNFSALGYAGKDRTVTRGPSPAAPPHDWLAWIDVRGTDFSRNTIGNDLRGTQVNALSGLTRRFTPNFLTGVLGGYETFDYRSDSLQGRLKGDGWTVGSYLGWKISQNIRFETGFAYSVIGYDGMAGLAAGSFSGNRWLVTGSLTGTYNSYGIQIEPSARIYALWEHENAYNDTFGTLQTARDFSVGRASGGVKMSYPVHWWATSLLMPYIGLFGDYYFNSDSAGTAAAAIPSKLILDGRSARAVSGLTATFGNGAQIAVGAERGGIGSSFGLWTYRARATLPFSAQ
ncbi:autotransporter domain-containing protein [Bradyrhizobium sp. JYMT SZCCT0428]|nr:autotransporter domain-containing protein [Bradyrhizobium sp. JYMT SZCCT0428]